MNGEKFLIYDKIVKLILTALHIVTNGNYNIHIMFLKRLKDAHLLADTQVEI